MGVASSHDSGIRQIEFIAAGSRSHIVENEDENEAKDELDHLLAAEPNSEPLTQNAEPFNPERRTLNHFIAGTYKVEG